MIIGLILIYKYYFYYLSNLLLYTKQSTLKQRFVSKNNMLKLKYLALDLADFPSRIELIGNAAPVYCIGKNGFGVSDDVRGA